MLRRRSLTLTAAGEAGSATASGSLSLDGLKRVVAVGLDYTGLPATTDVTIVAAGPLATGVLTRISTVTDAVFYPVVPASKAADGSASALTEVSPVAERLTVTLAQGDPAGTLTVTVVTDEG